MKHLEELEFFKGRIRIQFVQFEAGSATFLAFLSFEFAHVKTHIFHVKEPQMFFLWLPLVALRACQFFF